MTQIKATQAIRNAIESERASARFYEILAQRTPYPVAQTFLREMAATELRHGLEIVGLAKLLWGDAVPAHPDRDVSMVETLPNWGGAEAVTLPEGIAIAIASEQGAAAYYGALAAQLPAPAKDLFLRLARTEDEHAKSLLAYTDGALQEQ
jgi:rubrerythrin